MKSLTAAISLVVLGTGTAGAAIAYVSAAPQSTADQSLSAPAPAPPTAAPSAVATHPGARLRVRFRTCRPGARLEHGKCVRHVVHTVVAPAPVAPAAATVTSPGTFVGTSPDHSGDHRDRTGRREDDRSGSRHESEGHESEGHEDDGHPEPAEPSDD